jgi:hypothetical protein
LLRGQSRRSAVAERWLSASEAKGARRMTLGAPRQKASDREAEVIQDGLPLGCKQAWARGYMGTMHKPRRRDFVGADRAERDTLSRKQVIAAILTDQAVEKAMGWQPQWLGNSIEEQAGVVLKD